MKLKEKSRLNTSQLNAVDSVSGRKAAWQTPEMVDLSADNTDASPGGGNDGIISSAS